MNNFCPIGCKIKLRAVVVVMTMPARLAGQPKRAPARILRVALRWSVATFAADARKLLAATSGNEATRPTETGRVTLLTIRIDMRPLVAKCFPGVGVSR